MRIRRFLRQLLGRGAWRPVEVVGDAKTNLRLQYLTFKDLIASNDEILEVITRIEEKLRGGSSFSMAFIRSNCVTAASHAYRMIQNLNRLSGRRYADLYPRFTDIQKGVELALARSHTGDPGPRVLPLEAAHAALAHRLGGKNANLGEMKGRMGLPVPDGFAISSGGCREFFTASQLWDEIRALLQGLDVEDYGSVSETSAAIRSVILGAALPEPLGAEILEGYARLSERLDLKPRVSLRSSAVGEDGELSFAGQYVSVLNVCPERILEAYKEVIAGLYTPRAICYRTLRGILDEDVPMGVTCQVMVEAVASGVACSRDPGHPSAQRMVITGSWGLGSGTVEGSVSPDSWTLSRNGAPSVLSSSTGDKETSVEPMADGGVGAKAIPTERRAVLCLNEEQVGNLADLVLAIESHFGTPQEVEWALNEGGSFDLLQTRPLRVSASSAEETAEPPLFEGHPLLVKGAAASAGCGWGPAFLSRGPDDIQGFPEGGVLVARHSHPEYVGLMDKAAAIVTDIGAANGHMASLAREFGVPAVLETREAMARVAPGALVTVDGNRGAVYEGRVESLFLTPRPEKAARILGTPVFKVLEQVSNLVVTLNLTDPKSPDFSPQKCRTFHDIARFAHERSFDEMFRISDGVFQGEHRCLPLEARLPFTVYLIDLGGGLPPKPGPVVSPQQVRSLPMQALLCGMTDPELKWWAPRPLSLKGFAAVAGEALFSPMVEHGERQLGDRGYAIVADAYCHFSSRIGYHFTAVDAFCADQPSRNYISFRFKGGAADDARRTNRCILIERILGRLDIQVERQGDLVNARMRKYGKKATLEALGQIGRLIVATRQLDMRMGPGTSIDWHVQAFLDGNYLFDPDTVPPRSAEGP